MNFAPLFSGSSGNAVYVGSQSTHLLVDAGLSGARIAHELERVGLRADALAGILITHEHTDHIAGVGVMSRRFDLPVYATEGTWREMHGRLGKIAAQNVRVLDGKRPFRVGDIEVNPFPLSHDAADPVGYALRAGDARIAIATDTGEICESWMQYCEGADLVLLESNYDPAMLEAGPYPYPLKRRILGSQGHLSNDDAGRAAARLIASGVKRLVLGHLSRENNFPELALRAVADALHAAGLHAAIDIARRDGATGLYTLQGELWSKIGG